MLVNERHLAELNSTKQTIRARVEIYKGSALERICTCSDILSDFTIERLGEGKFFGFGICQQLRTNLIDINRELTITNEHRIEVSFGVNNEFIYPFPAFYVQEVKRDETSNMLSITANDALYNSVNRVVGDLPIRAPYTILEVVAACAALLDLPFNIENVDDDSFNTLYEVGANFSGKETIRDVLNAIAEVTQTIYYLDSNWALTFKRLDKDNEPVITINKNQYITLANAGTHAIGNIINVTELGDNTSPSVYVEGEDQYIRENPFWNNRNDIGSLVDQAQEAVEGLTISEFSSEWVGNYLLEIADKIAFVAEDNTVFESYLLDDSISFTGVLSQITKWEPVAVDSETAASPASLGDALNQTTAKVDKVRKTITLMVNDMNKISSDVETIRETQTTFTQTAEDITLRIESIETTGATKVNTGTGFTFDEEGLRINKDNSGIENLIDNTGMYVRQDGSEVLTANEGGVAAKNLHATTYLFVGSNSRFEDYENGSRTGCFWIGR